VVAFLGYDPFLPGTLPGADTVLLTQEASLNSRLVAYRHARGLRQNDLARALGVDPSTLAKWEREPQGRYFNAVWLLSELTVRPLNPARPCDDRRSKSANHARSGDDVDAVLGVVREGRIVPPLDRAAGKRLPHLPGGRCAGVTCRGGDEGHGARFSRAARDRAGAARRDCRVSSRLCDASFSGAVF